MAKRKQFNVRVDTELLGRIDAWVAALNGDKDRHIKLKQADVVRGGLGWLAEHRPNLEAPPGTASVDWEKTSLPRPWRPGDPEPANEPPFRVHLQAGPGPDPWATACGRRAPRAALLPHGREEWTDCPDCRTAWRLPPREDDASPVPDAGAAQERGSAPIPQEEPEGAGGAGAAAAPEDEEPPQDAPARWVDKTDPVVTPERQKPTRVIKASAMERAVDPEARRIDTFRTLRGSAP